jgi:energy-coupling factor transport system ATP-binding protein
LAREPALLIADEVTSMVDPRKRRPAVGALGLPTGGAWHWCTSLTTTSRLSPRTAIALTGRESTHEADMIETVARQP